MKLSSFIVLIWYLWNLVEWLENSWTKNSYPLVYGGYATSYFNNANQYVLPFCNVKHIQFKFFLQLNSSDFAIGADINEITLPGISTDVISSMNFVIMRIDQNSGEVLWANVYLYPDIQISILCSRMEINNQVTVNINY